MANKCALPGCANFVGVHPRIIMGDSRTQYCSDACASIAWEDRKKRKRPASASAEEGAQETMERPAPEFGDSGVVRKFCDRDGCRNPVLLSWRGRNGEYCSNACYKLNEEENEMTATEETTTAAPAAEKPIAAGKPPAPAKKKGKKTTSAAKKTAPAAKKTAPAAKAEPEKDKAFGAFRAGTSKAAVAEALGDGKYHTVEELRTVCEKAGAGIGQIGWALKELPERAAVEVEWKNDKKEEVRVKKIAKK